MTSRAATDERPSEGQQFAWACGMGVWAWGMGVWAYLLLTDGDEFGLVREQINGVDRPHPLGHVPLPGLGSQVPHEDGPVA